MEDSLSQRKKNFSPKPPIPQREFQQDEKYTPLNASRANDEIERLIRQGYLLQFIKSSLTRDDIGGQKEQQQRQPLNNIQMGVALMFLVFPSKPNIVLFPYVYLMCLAWCNAYIPKWY
ncbi:hypothetical protein IEQ34_012601 [Dendrobium chrysotoxum]|uniref:Uncharacterized protein n=1 Tax=Dendrobium chrysotoxum TaxID=161865 RepID=A0AAV7GLA7_DENCH|nr:hypothetical protein IEQ34_012601 [Dendrobium chrysotoxum]